MGTGLQHRKADPTAMTWEPYAIVGGAWALGTAYSPAAAVAVAGWAGGRGWAWPGDPIGLARLLVTDGSAATLAARTAVPAGAAGGPGVAVLLAVLAGAQLLLVAALVVAVRRWWGGWTGRSRTGFADVAAAQRVLGVGRLRAARSEVRPDLYRRGAFRQPRRRRHPAAGAEAKSPEPPAAQPSAAPPPSPDTKRRNRFQPQSVGWRLGAADVPRGGGQLWVPFDRTAGVVGPQGSGKTLDLLVPALLTAPGAALVTLTKASDLLLSIGARAAGGRPVVVLDPFGLAPGLPQLVWDPVAGCADSMLAERRAKAFTAGTITAATHAGTGDDAARFYAHEAAKVLQAYLHAAALAGATLDDILAWVADPRSHPQPEEVLRTHPGAAPFWDGLLAGAVHGDERTAANTIATVQQAVALFFQASIRARCTPSSDRPATDLAELIAAGGTVYLLGREDPYASASPLMTAVAEDVLDTALRLANTSEHGRLCPPMIAVLDELPSTAPLPTLATRMANERAMGLCFVYATQTWRQLVMVFGEATARSLYTLTNNLIVFGGSKDAAWNRELSDLIGTERVVRRSRTHGWSTASTSTSVEDTLVLRPEEIRQLPSRRALVIPENAQALIATLTRCVEGRPGRRLLADQATWRAQLTTHPQEPDADRDGPPPAAVATAARQPARRLRPVQVRETAPIEPPAQEEDQPSLAPVPRRPTGSP